MIARVLAASLAVTWPASLLVDDVLGDGALNGKGDDIATGCLVALLILGLLAAGWLKPVSVVIAAVAVVGAGVPFVYEALSPTECPAGAAGIDCLPVSVEAVAVVPGVLLVLCGALIRRVAGRPAVSVVPR